MSTKIFPHRPKAFKPPKPPDHAYDRLALTEQNRLRQYKAARKEERQIMADLRAEDLQRRAALIPAAATKLDLQWSHAPTLWGETIAMRLLRKDNKSVRKICNSLYRYETMPDKQFKPIIDKLIKSLGEAAQKAKIPLTLEEVSECADYAMQVFFDETKRIRKLDNIETGKIKWPES